MTEPFLPSERLKLGNLAIEQPSNLQICVILTTVTMHNTQASLLLLLTYLLTFASAGRNEIGGMFPPRDLIGNIGAKASESLLPRASTQNCGPLCSLRCECLSNPKSFSWNHSVSRSKRNLAI